LPDRAVDEALSQNRIDPTLPMIRKRGLEVIRAGYETREEAASGIPEAIGAFYSEEYPEIAASRQPAIDQAAGELLALYEQNVFPEYNVGWGTYPNQLGHEDFPGCFRCHDGRHKSNPDTISHDCTVCHEIVGVAQPVTIAHVQAERITSSAERLPTKLVHSTSLGDVIFNHRAHVARFRWVGRT
jgi:hypothetical protein